MTSAEHVWSKEKILGTGGFGTVILWVNVLTREEIALKECRWGHDSTMTAKHRQRWKLEVDIMRRLNHPNVVKAIEVPSDLDVPGSSLPVMAMEYCRGGDLRKTLNKPENCCGLPEKQTRVLLRHVVSAIEYLHCMRIIHRDLKPENIVVQEKDGKCFYKLIDLGYAKELDQGSLCTSFVGTLQYLAPELFLSQTYTSSVDYWSLGLVSHEIITGQRPFLPNMSPAQWIPVVKHKTSDDIRAFLNDEGKVAFSKEICPCNQISDSLKIEVERWLRLLLEFEPKQRGHRNGVPAFQLFGQIREQKIMQIFCLDTCELLSYPINEGTSLATIARCIEKDIHIPVASQLMLLPKGFQPDPSKSAIQCWFDPEEDDDNLVYLFNSSFLSVFPNRPLILPPLVERMMQNPLMGYSYNNQKAAWRETISFIQKQITLYNRLVQAYKVDLLHLLRKNSTLQKHLSMTRQALDKLEAKSDFFKTSLHQDLSKFVNQFTNPQMSSESMQEKWKQVMVILDQVKEAIKKTSVVNQAGTEVTNKTVEPQKSPYARTKHSDCYLEIHRNILLLFEDLRKRNREERKLKWDNSEMIQLICKAIHFQETTFKEIYSHMRKVEEIKLEIDGLSPELENISLEIETLEQKIVQAQLDRQDDIWGLLNFAMEKLNSSSNIQKETENSSVFKSKPEISVDGEEDQIDSASDLFSSLHASLGGNNESLNSFLMLHTKDSQKVRKENMTLRNELDSMLSQLTLSQQLFEEK